MPYKDKEKLKEYKRQWEAAHREQLRAQQAARRPKYAERKRAYDDTPEHQAAHRLADAKYRATHKAETSAYHARRYAEQHDRLREMADQWQREHPAYAKAMHAAWRQSHKEHIGETVARWRKEHPDMVAASKARRRAREKSAPINDMTAAQWKVIKAAHHGRCGYCLRHSNELTQDHMTPLTRGGAHTSANIMPACRSCNAEKGTKTVQEYFDAVTGGW